MKPTPLTNEQIISLGYNSGDPDGLLEFAKNVVSARDAQWDQMLAEQEPVDCKCADQADCTGKCCKPQPAQPKPKQHPNALSAFASAIRCGLAKPSDWPAYEQGYTQGSYDAEMLQRQPAEDVNKQLLEALKGARDCVEHWAGYAGEYFRKKHDINGDLAMLDAAIADGETK